MKQVACQGLHYVKPLTKNPVVPKKHIAKEELPQIRHVVAVASGKGGVGKSTVAVNLAVALAQQGFKVGLMDADVYGPSIPKMTGTEHEQPAVEAVAGVERIMPVARYGVKWMSIGYFSAAGEPLIWRGPMATNALKQLLNQVEWGALDVLLIDLPPGTGDIHVSIIQEVKLSGAVVVSTPQAVALADVEKGVNMFLNDKVRVPVLGLVENMAWFTPEELPHNKYYIFGKEGAARLAEKLHLPLLAQLPIVQSIRESGDEGTPIALKKNAAGTAFLALAGKIATMLQF
ncbi:MAG: Mrp/NBP35 family ATP-binding protein [Prevotellaceae bacterium]|jgi:ATP-binding protein involved in chromosome partitioning|nr:Mrp/NBP35 family ATP-binding protein [Prevotellaceae bacterium]